MADGRRVTGGHRPRRKGAISRLRAERASLAGLRGWKLEEAKARFSEVVRRAREEGPQRVTYRGEDAVVVIAVEELRRLLPAARPKQSLVQFLRGTALGELEIERAPDRGRNLDL